LPIFYTQMGLIGLWAGAERPSGRNEERAAERTGNEGVGNLRGRELNAEFVE